VVEIDESSEKESITGDIMLKDSGCLVGYGGVLAEHSWSLCMTDLLKLLLA
jgi:hypothetical protein